jgi:hypothetical protein
MPCASNVRPRVEGLGQLLVHAQGARMGRERAPEVSLRGEDQPFAAAGARLAPGALDPAHALDQIGQQPARLCQLAQLDEGLDPVRQLTGDARFAPPRRGEALRERPEDRVGSGSIADG